jgi:hypothetical protein
MIEKATCTVTLELPSYEKEKFTNILYSLIEKYEGHRNFKISFEDEYELYFGGKELPIGGFSKIIIYGRKERREHYNALRKDIINTYIQVLNIPEQYVFVQFADYDKYK